MKKKNRGFVLAETLIVSTVVLTTLLLVYVLFSSIVRNYDTNLKYNSVEKLYETYYIKNYINQFNLGTLLDDPDSTVAFFYYDANSGNAGLSELFTILGVDNIVFTDANLYKLNQNNNGKPYYLSTSLSQNMKDFIKFTSGNLNKNSLSLNYRILVEFNDGNMATLLIKGEDNNE